MQVVTLTKDELLLFGKQTAKQAVEEMLNLLNLHTQTKESDIISQEEALELIGCSLRQLAQLRKDRKIEYFIQSRPYKYSKKSIETYLNGTSIKKVQCT